MRETPPPTHEIGPSTANRKALFRSGVTGYVHLLEPAPTASGARASRHRVDLVYMTRRFRCPRGCT